MSTSVSPIQTSRVLLVGTTDKTLEAFPCEPSEGEQKTTAVKSSDIPKLWSWRLALAV